MADVSQVETSFSVEPRTTPVNPTSGTRPERPQEPSFSEREQAAFTVDLSSEAQQLSASANAAPQTPGGESGQDQESQPSAGFDSTFETSATDGIDESDGSARSTNQVTSFESERSGNGPRNASEANRTLGQVVDTFA